MIVLVGGTKGGSGKSTVATNLAVMRSLAGRDVLLVDADDQETSYDFTALRNQHRDGRAGYTCIKLTGGAVRTETIRLREKYEDIIIDAGGRDTTGQRAAMAVADLLLVPFVPRSFDIWTIEKVGQVVQEMRPANPELLACTFLSKADAQGSENDEASQMLGEVGSFAFLDAPIGYRKAFGHAAAAGLGVVELAEAASAETRKKADPKAVLEVEKLYGAIYTPNAGPLWGQNDSRKVIAMGGA